MPGIGDCQICGESVTIEEGTILYEGSVLGPRPAIPTGVVHNADCLAVWRDRRRRRRVMEEAVVSVTRCERSTTGEHIYNIRGICTYCGFDLPAKATEAMFA